MDLLTTYPNGTTIESYMDDKNDAVYRVCTGSGSLCRLTTVYHCAVTYATVFEETYPVHPDTQPIS